MSKMIWAVLLMLIPVMTTRGASGYRAAEGFWQHTVSPVLNDERERLQPGCSDVAWTQYTVKIRQKLCSKKSCPQACSVELQELLFQWVDLYDQAVNDQQQVRRRWKTLPQARVQA